MIKLIVLVALIAVAVAIPVTSKRRYFVEEEKANSPHFALMPDYSGKVHLINLKDEPKNGKIATIDDVSLHMYTRANPTTEEAFDIKPAQFDGVINSELFDPSRKIIVTTHGWTGDQHTLNNVIIRDTALANEDCTVFVLDYYPASIEFYTVARRSVPIVGKIAGEFLNKLMSQYNISPSNIILSGHSLGGHVIGAIGQAMNGKPKALIALDPAKPLFFVDEPEDCLDPSDGEFVQVIHTNGGLLGFRSSLGHADYFPAGGGMNQPGCGADIVGICAHIRAMHLYGEAIVSGGFKSLACDSYESYKAGNCNGNQIAYMGGLPIDNTAFGDFYLDTNDESPFAMN